MPVAAALIMAASLAACSSVMRQPEVRLEGMRVGGIGLRGGTLIARVHVTNPNSFDLEARSLTYDLQIPDPEDESEWVSLAQDTVHERVRVREHDSTVIEVPIEVRYADFGGALRAIMDRGTFNYRVRGTIELSAPIGRTIPYSRTGTVSLEGVR